MFCWLFTPFAQALATGSRIVHHHHLKQPVPHAAEVARQLDMLHSYNTLHPLLLKNRLHWLDA
jgi:hypothetical protein